jgi:hypothetical protein
MFGVAFAEDEEIIKMETMKGKKMPRTRESTRS